MAPAPAEQVKDDSRRTGDRSNRRKARFVGLLRPLAIISQPLLGVLRWLAPRYFINAWHEVKLVTWPTRRETWRLTLAVFIFAAVFGGVVWTVDWALEALFKKVVLK